MGEGKTALGRRPVSPAEREALADERDRRADQREALANERDLKADQREALADERERKLDERTRAIAAEVKRIEKESQALIKRSQARLAGKRESVHRHLAEARHPGGHPQPGHAGTGTAAGNEPTAAAALSAPTAIQRAIDLRERVSITLAALAATEEEVARVHETLADQHPSDNDHFRRAAAEARSRAAQLRETGKQYRD